MLVPVDESGLHLRIHPGPLLTDFLAGAGGGFREYVQQGGYELSRRVVGEMSREDIIAQIEASGLRGRGGGGFPTGLKWSQVERSPQPERYFVCNCSSGQPGGFKERFLLGANPHRILEAVTIAGFAVGARTALLFLGNGLEGAERILTEALADAREAGVAGRSAGGPQVLIYRSPGGYLTGEETAALELIEGRVGQPRGKPPMPTKQGLLGAPTVINNLETVLQAYQVLKSGPQRFRETGTLDAPGTILVCLSGDVERPGLYEVPLGTPLREIVFEYGGGGVHGQRIKAVLVGGVGSRFIGSEHMDVPLDYDSLREAGADLNSGVVMVVSDAASGVDLARQLARFYSEASCGKCQPCKDGTGRTLVMFNRLEDLDQKSVDVAGKTRPPSPRSRGLTIIQDAGQPGGISYTDMAEGLDKIRLLAEWYKYRGDCHHPTEAARAIQSLLDVFGEELKQYRREQSQTLREATA